MPYWGLGNYGHMTVVDDRVLAHVLTSGPVARAGIIRSLWPRLGVLADELQSGDRMSSSIRLRELPGVLGCLPSEDIAAALANDPRNVRAVAARFGIELPKVSRRPKAVTPLTPSEITQRLVKVANDPEAFTRNTAWNFHERRRYGPAKTLANVLRVSGSTAVLDALDALETDPTVTAAQWYTLADWLCALWLRGGDGCDEPRWQVLWQRLWCAPDSCVDPEQAVSAGEYLCGESYTWLVNHGVNTAFLRYYQGPPTPAQLVKVMAVLKLSPEAVPDLLALLNDDGYGYGFLAVLALRALPLSMLTAATVDCALNELALEGVQCSLAPLTNVAPSRWAKIRAGLNRLYRLDKYAAHGIVAWHDVPCDCASLFATQLDEPWVGDAQQEDGRYTAWLRHASPATRRAQLPGANFDLVLAALDVLDDLDVTDDVAELVPGIGLLTDTPHDPAAGGWVWSWLWHQLGDVPSAVPTAVALMANAKLTLADVVTTARASVR